MMTSSTSSRLSRILLTASVIAILPKRVAETELRTPLKLPIGVRAALTITAFFIGSQPGLLAQNQLMSEPISQRNEPLRRSQQRNERWTHSFLFAPPKNRRCDYLELLHGKRTGLE